MEAEYFAKYWEKYNKRIGVLTLKGKMHRRCLFTL
jgi:hypothetical protein